MEKVSFEGVRENKGRKERKREREEKGTHRDRAIKSQRKREYDHS